MSKLRAMHIAAAMIAEGVHPHAALAAAARRTGEDFETIRRQLKTRTVRKERSQP